MDNQIKHTPGPWKITKSGNSITYNRTGGMDWIFLRHDEFLAEFKNEQNANMALVSAAPDLLEVLTELYKSDQTMVFIPRHIQAKMKAALAKAKGTDIEDKRTY